MDTITVTARRWERGWELEIDPDNITQVRSLDKAAQQVRDYLGTRYPERDVQQIEVQLDIELGSLGEEVSAARAAARVAQEQQVSAAQRTRSVVVALVRDGYSGTDVAAILGVTRSRVSQLLKEGSSEARKEVA